MTPHGPDRIVVRAPNWIGDVVLSLGAVRDLRRSFPASRISVLARPWVKDIYGAVREVDDVLPSLGPRRDAAALRGRFDLGVLLPNSFGTALALWLAGVKERWGYATEGRGVLLTRRARLRAEIRGRSQVYYYRAMLAGVGLEVSADPDVTLRCPPSWQEAAVPLLKTSPRWIGLNPGAAFGGAKRWLPERFAEAGDRLAEAHGASAAIVGSAAERPAAEAIAARMRAPARVLCGETTLPQLVGVLSQLDLLLTNDSGPMHLAAALGTPLVAVFGPTDPAETAPVGRHRLVREPVPCSPCLLRECPIDHRCMTRIQVDRVVAAALELGASA
jgi:heptosyltransferase-2